MTEAVAFIVLVIIAAWFWQGTPTRAEKLDAILDHYYEQSIKGKYNGYEEEKAQD